MSQSAPNETIHITLVHGTFAPGAAWTKPGSLLRRKLAEELKGPIEFHSDFRWWGLPSHLNRHFAGKRLQKYLLELTRHHTGRHFIIGHSHGALVSLYAVRDHELAKRIEGVVSLSTPYLIARPRELSVLGRIATIFGSLAFFAVTVSLARVPFAAYLDSELPWYLGIPIFLLGVVLSLLALWVLVGIGLGVEKLTTWFLTTMKIPSINSGRLLIVRGPSDEASTLINLFHGLELLVTAIWGRRGPFDRIIIAAAQRLWARYQAILDATPILLLALAYVWLFIGALVLVAAMIAVVVLVHMFPEETEELLKAAPAPFGLRSPLWGFLSIAQHYATTLLPSWLVVTLAAVALPTFIAFCVAGLLLSLAVSVGIVLGLCFLVAVLCTAVLAIVSVPELGPCAAMIVVSVEATPPGRYEVESGEDTAGVDTFLTHSWSYSHPQALTAIATWLKAPKPDAPLTPPPPKPKSDNPFF